MFTRWIGRIGWLSPSAKGSLHSHGCIARVDSAIGPDGKDPVLALKELGNIYSRIMNPTQAVLEERVAIPSGYRLEWGGQYQHQQTAMRRLAVLVPVAILAIYLLLRPESDVLLVSAALAVLVAPSIQIAYQWERAVVLRFGKYHQTTEAGLHWRPWGIDTIRKVDVTAASYMIASIYYVILQKDSMGEETYKKVTDMLIDCLSGYFAESR